MTHPELIVKMSMNLQGKIVLTPKTVTDEVTLQRLMAVGCWSLTTSLVSMGWAEKPRRMVAVGVPLYVGTDRLAEHPPTYDSTTETETRQVKVLMAGPPVEAL